MNRYKVIRDNSTFPKGSKYYKGSFARLDSYCSDKIIYGETILD